VVQTVITQEVNGMTPWMSAPTQKCIWMAEFFIAAFVA
jgi:hypothetical protein